MRYLKAFGAFWWDFLVGDEPRLAAGAVVAVAATAGLSALGWPAWWLLPLAAVGVLFWVVVRAARRSTVEARE
jgi:hypothetical protein